MAELKPNVLEDIEEILRCPDHLEHMVKISMRMDHQIISKLIDFLKQYQITFVWSIDDMVRISLEIITHKLNVNPNYPPVRQKQRKFASKQNKIINKEMEKLKQNGFIREIYYPD